MSPLLHHRSVALSALVGIGGCGPLTVPMVQRLEEKDQQQIDEAWSCMLSPPDRLDRTVLLDTIISFQLYQLGVDSLRMVSDKSVDGGTVVMEVRFDRGEPDHDEFTFVYRDARGRDVRRESYTRSEVEERVKVLFEPVCLPSEPEIVAQMDPQEVEDLRRRQAEQDEAQEAVRAATQPAIRD